MAIALLQNAGAAHPRKITGGEQDRLEEEIRGALLSVSSSDPKIRERKKDLRKGFNKAPSTLAQFLVQSFNEQRPITKRLTNAIGDFFSARTQTLQRRLRELSPIETRAEGKFEQLQNAIDLGDTSTPTLKRFVEEIDEYAAVLAEMRAAAIAEIYKAEAPR